MDEILKAGADAIERINHSKEKLTVVVGKLESAADKSQAVEDAVAELNSLLGQNREVLNRLEESHTKLMESVQAEWRDTRESIRDRVDNTFSQLKSEIGMTKLTLETQLEAGIAAIKEQISTEAENVVAEMPRGPFGKRGKKKA